MRENVRDMEDDLQAADIGLFTSETESFCLSLSKRCILFSLPKCRTAGWGESLKSCRIK